MIGFISAQLAKSVVKLAIRGRMGATIVRFVKLSGLSAGRLVRSSGLINPSKPNPRIKIDSIAAQLKPN